MNTKGKWMILAALVSVASGCGGGSSEVIECTPASTCLKDGVPGRCAAAPSGKMYCAYPDSMCPSGERWGLFAGDHLANVCSTLPDGGMDTDASMMTDGGGDSAVNAPAISIDPTTQGFGSVVQNMPSAEATFTVRNTGTASTMVLTASLAGSDPGQFSISNDGCSTLALVAGGSCLVRGRFMPTSPGNKAAMLSVSDGTLSATASLTGTGLAPGALTITPAMQDFSTVVTGQMSPEFTFTVQNTGGVATGAVTMALSEPSYTFSMNGCSAALAPTATCTVRVRLVPTTAGSKVGSLTATATPGGTGAAQLMGVAVAPASLTIAPGSRDFGSTLVSTPTAATDFTIQNPGGVATPALTVGVMGTDSNQFNVTANNCGATLPAAGSCVVSVRFAPTSSGTKNAMVVASAGSLTPAMASVTGLAARVPVTNGQAADLVLGQANLTSGSPNDPSEGINTLAYPQSVATDGTRLWVADTGNARVLQWDALPIADRAFPSQLIGQSQASSHTTNVASQAIIRSAVGVAAAGGKLLVVDGASNRVLVWTSLPTTSTQPANFVLGQINFTATAACALGATGLCNPERVWTDGTRIAVADTGNNRVLLWNQFPTSNGQAADVVIGQANFNSNAAGAVSASSLDKPRGMAFGQNRFFVADTSRHRVLAWEGFPTTNGQAANFVVGQPNMTDSAANAGAGQGATSLNAAGFNFVYGGGVAAGAGSLFVADTQNQRVMVFTPIPTSTGASANAVLGRPDFMTTGLAFASATTLHPYDVTVAGNRLFVVDNSFNRAVRFNLTP